MDGAHGGERAPLTGRKLVDEIELLRSQAKAYEFYAGLIERATGAGTLAKLPRWDEQRALEYRDLAAQLRKRIAELEAQEAARAAQAATAQSSQPAVEPAQPVATSGGEASPSSHD